MEPLHFRRISDTVLNEMTGGLADALEVKDAVQVGSGEVRVFTEYLGFEVVGTEGVVRRKWIGGEPGGADMVQGLGK